jgi:hypothetical protein
MAFLQRLSGWFERMLDTDSTDDDLLAGDVPADQGFLMSAPAPAPEASAPEEPVEAADPGGPAAFAVQPAPMEPVSARPEVKVVNFAELPPDEPDDEDELSEEAAALLAEEAAAKENPPPAAETAEGAAPAADAASPVKAVGSGASGETPEQEQEAMVTASGTDELLSSFAHQKSEYAEFTDTMENYTAEDVLADARDVLSLLPRKEAEAA